MKKLFAVILSLGVALSCAITGVYAADEAEDADIAFGFDGCQIGQSVKTAGLADGGFAINTATNVVFAADPEDSGNVVVHNDSLRKASFNVDDQNLVLFGKMFSVSADFYFAEYGDGSVYPSGNLQLLSLIVDGKNVDFTRVSADGTLILYNGTNKVMTEYTLPSKEWFELKLEISPLNGSYVAYVNGYPYGKGTFSANAPSTSSAIKVLQQYFNYNIYVDNVSIKTQGSAEDGLNYGETDSAFVYPQYSEYKKSAFVIKSDHELGVPVDIVTYAKAETDERSKVVLYVINSKAERVGTESDEAIMGDLLDEGYIVMTIDYRNADEAQGAGLDRSVLAIRNEIYGGKYYKNVEFDIYKTYVVPSGDRIITDVVYYDYLESACVGTKEYCVKVWNGDMFRNKFGSAVPGGYFTATDFSELVNSDGSAIDTTLRLDIIYPSEPKEEVPVYMLASSTGHPARRNLSTMNADRMHFNGFLFSGYACVCYDHEFIPFLKGYGYMDTYTLHHWNGVKTQTAAIRCVRYYADLFGYSKEKIGVMGHSKSSYDLLLATKDPTALSEKSTYSGHKQSETYGEQPFLTYYGSNEKIPSNAACVYSSMGEGARSYERYKINSASSPVMIVCGYYCEYNSWQYWDAIQTYYMNNNVRHVPISMLDLGHTYAYGTDTVYKYDRYDAVFKFFGYYLGKKGPSLIYTSAGGGTVSASDGLYLQFVADFGGVNVAEHITVFDGDGNAVSGKFTSAAGGLRLVFKPDVAFEEGKTYVVRIDDGLKDKFGAAVGSYEQRFVYGGAV